MHPSLLLRKQLLRSKKQAGPDSRSPVTPLRSAACPTHRTIVLASQAALVLFLSMPSVPARAEQQAWVCPEMLMDFECVQYRQRLERAVDKPARNRIDLEYRQILAERRQACLCSVTQAERESLIQAAANRADHRLHR